jgi:two-component system sensor histidine kinase ChvG
MMDGLDRLGDWLTGASRPTSTSESFREHQEAARELVGPALAEGPVLRRGESVAGPGFLAAAPVGPVTATAPLAVLVLADAPDGLDRLVRSEREHAMRIFLVAALISVGLSLMLAKTISTSRADPATAAKTEGDGFADRSGPGAGRDRMPDLAAPPDEIGRLSASVRGMLAALHQRIESNEQFAADVAHEIKNPLTSLLCAVDTMRITMRDDQRDRLLDVIEHDVRRLDRLVSDISSASRLDSDLVKQEQVRFDLVEMLRNVVQYLEPQALSKEVTVITDFPDQSIVITGLEARLAQVFVNLITNAISFCEAGDAIRIWACLRADRVLVVVEDTGPGIYAGTFDKIFERFYSNRPERDFGNHSGLGLAISKQIVEAHDGVIWAENIQAPETDATSDPLGARFVVGLSSGR